MKDAHLPDKLPEEILDQLDPKLVKLYSQLSSAVSLRIAALVRRAGPLGIHPNRLVKYAFLYATAERQAQSDVVSKEHATRSKSEMAGILHGFRAGYWDHAEAKHRYRRGRRARQQVGASLEGVLRKWKEVEQVVQKQRSYLPVHAQPRFSDESLAGVRKLLLDMQRSTVLDEEDVLGEKDRERVLTEAAQTYIWWCFAMPPYGGKWKDMHQLARAWKLSDATYVTTFRTVVGRICKRVNCTRCPLGTAWEAILSEKP